MVLPLEGIKVLELGLWVLGPSCARVLGEMGADVIKIEDPDGGDPGRGIMAPKSVSGGAGVSTNPLWEWWNLGKRDIAVDLTREAGREIIYQLVKTSDVFVTNFRPAIVDRFGLDYESVARINPKIIYAQATGFGINGPDRDRRAFDETAFWTRSGIMSILGEPDVPPVPLRGAMGDLTTAIFLAGATVTALLARDRFGFGQKVDISLMASGMWVAGGDFQRYLVWGERYNYHKLPRNKMVNPLRNTFQTKDGKWLLLIGLRPERYWSRFCQTIEREDLEHDPRFESFQPMMENRVALLHILQEAFLSRTLDEWRPRLNAAGFPWSPVQSFPEVINDPQARVNDFFVSYDHPAYGRMEGVANPVKLSQSPETVRMPAPEFGQHTEEVLLQLGYSWEDIGQFKQQGVIA